MTIAWREEIEEGLRTAMADLGFEAVEESVGQALQQLKSISGRLALRLIHDNTRAKEVAGLGAAVAWMKAAGDLADSILIPVDSHPEIFASEPSVPGSEAPDIAGSMFIGTFHAFCTNILRQHGTHIGIENTFTIYSLDDDRRQVLRDALRRDPESIPIGHNEDQILKTIDNLMSRFITPEATPKLFSDGEQGKRYAKAYALYEAELRRLNALDFNSLLLQTHRLIATYPLSPHATGDPTRTG